MGEPFDVCVEESSVHTTLPGHVSRMLALMRDLDRQNQRIMEELDGCRHKVIESLYTHGGERINKAISPQNRNSQIQTNSLQGQNPASNQVHIQNNSLNTLNTKQDLKLSSKKSDHLSSSSDLSAQRHSNSQQATNEQINYSNLKKLSKEENEGDSYVLCESCSEKRNLCDSCITFGVCNECIERSRMCENCNGMKFVSNVTLKHIQSLDIKSKSLIREKIALENQLLHMLRHEKEKMLQDYQKLMQQTASHAPAPSLTTSTQLSQPQPYTFSNHLKPNTNSTHKETHTHSTHKHHSHHSHHARHDLLNNYHTPVTHDMKRKVDANKSLYETTTQHLQGTRPRSDISSSVSAHERAGKRHKKDKGVHITVRSSPTASIDENVYQPSLNIHKRATQDVVASTQPHTTMRISVASTREPEKTIQPDHHTPMQRSEDTRPTWDASTPYPDHTKTESYVEEDMWDGICPICQKGESETQHMMVGCDACNNWFHFECVNYNATGSEDAAWFCPQCIADRIVPYTV